MRVDHGEDPKKRIFQNSEASTKVQQVFFDFKRNLGVVVYSLEFWVLCVLMSQLIYYEGSRGGHRYGVGMKLLGERRFQEALVIIILGRYCFRLARKARR